MTTAIETTGLTKRFQNTTAVGPLTMQVPVGSVFGFLGGNGAGKTTTIRMLMGQLHPTAGTMTVLGEDPWNHNSQTRQRIAYVSSDMAVPAWMTTQRIIQMGAGLFAKWNANLAATLTKEFDLNPRQSYGSLSTGQRRKMLILSALCQSAELLILDEPALGLDVEARHVFLERILDIACTEGHTVFLSSHLLSDVERVVDRIGILRKGLLVCEGELEALKSGVQRLQIAEQVSESLLAEHFRVVSCEISTWGTDATVSGFTDAAYQQFAACLEKPESLRKHAFNLEELYLHLSRPKPANTDAESISHSQESITA